MHWKLMRNGKVFGSHVRHLIYHSIYGKLIAPEGDSNITFHGSCLFNEIHTEQEKKMERFFMAKQKTFKFCCHRVWKTMLVTDAKLNQVNDL